MIVGFSGKKQSGKNTSVEIWQLISTYYSLKEFEDTAPKESLNEFIFKYLKLSKENVKYLAPNHGSNWIQKSYAHKLKQIVCLLIGCTMEQLEDNVFKETPLKEDWDCFEETSSYGASPRLMLEYNEAFHCAKRQLTPRLLLQLLGTQCGREIIHPELWVNALFADYTPKMIQVGSHVDKLSWEEEYPNWLVTDCRFPNEIEAIYARGGITIRVDRGDLKSTDNHESETALDNYSNFDYIINNPTGSIEYLIDEIKKIMIKEKVINV